jgi:hypothetical protein
MDLSLSHKTVSQKEFIEFSNLPLSLHTHRGFRLDFLMLFSLSLSPSFIGLPVPAPESHFASCDGKSLFNVIVLAELTLSGTLLAFFLYSLPLLTTVADEKRAREKSKEKERHSKNPHKSSERLLLGFVQNCF